MTNPAGRAFAAVLPLRLGTPFRWLLASSWTTNAADGIAVAAGPLLVASQTNDPTLVATAGFLQQLPWVLFGLHAGAIADRFDRRTILLAVNGARVVVLAALAATIASGSVDVAVVLAAMFLLGTAETFVDITATTLLPMVVDAADLGLANARLGVGHITVNRLVGPPIGALLFAAGMAIPFVTQAVCVAVGVVLLLRIRLGPVTRPEALRPMRAEIAEGVRWLWGHPQVRTLTLTVTAFNVTFGSTLGDSGALRLRAARACDAVGFGLLTAVGAVGRVLGSASYGRLERRLGAATLMRIGLAIETAAHLTLALTTQVAVAVPGAVRVRGARGGGGTTVCHRPPEGGAANEFQGRVGSVCTPGAGLAGLAVGAVDRRGSSPKVWGITGPFWFAFAGSLLLLAMLWCRLDALTADRRPPQQLARSS